MKTNKNSAVDKELYKHYLIDEVRILKEEKLELEARLTELLQKNESHRETNEDLWELIQGMHQEPK